MTVEKCAMGEDSDALTTAEYDGSIRRLVRSCLRPDGGSTERGAALQRRWRRIGRQDAKMGGGVCVMK
jgi:hypothetical protein